MNLKTIGTTALIFLTGLCIGILLCSYLFSKAIQPLRESIRIDLKVEDEFQAKRETRKGNITKAIFHQKNSIRYSSPDYTKTFTKSRYEEYDDLFSPFAYLILGKIAETSDPNGIGRDRGESIQRGYLAYLLEKNNQKEEAKLEWQIGAKLAGDNDTEKLKSLTNYLIKNNDEVLSIEAENVVLGKE